MDLRTQLVNSITKNLKIDQDFFAVGMIEESLEGIKPEQYTEFYNALMGDEHDYLKPLDRVAKVSKRFKGSDEAELFKDTQSMAKDFYNKIYSVNAQMTTYSQANRDRIPNDREFFINMDYSKMLDKKTLTAIFTKKDLYILDELGGGEYIINIKFITNSSEAINKIESIIKHAIRLKHLKPKHEAISHEVRKMLK